LVVATGVPTVRELAGLKWGDIQFGESDDDPDRYALAELRSPLVADHADP
jgi:hypothetical protein